MECTRCLYNTDFIPYLTFNEDGECEFCQQHDEWEKQYPMGDAGWKELCKIAHKVEESTKNTKYNCIVGLSGGCDSSFTLHIVKDWLKLKPLAVNYDNGWDTETARSNIRKMCKGLGVDLLVCKPDQEEVNDIWKAFLKSGARDVEAPTDIALTATLYEAAAKNGLRYIFNGHSFRTEGWVPKGLSYMDGKYVKDVHKKYGTMPMRTFPNLSITKFLWWMCVKRIKRVRPIYYTNYNKAKVKEMLNREYGWEWYGSAHAENKFTAWFGQFYRPVRCDFDARIIYLSAGLRSGRITREEAKAEIAKAMPMSRTYQSAIEDAFGWSHARMNELLNQPVRKADEFRTYQKTFRRLKPLFWVLYKANIVPKTFYTKYCQ